MRQGGRVFHPVPDKHKCTYNRNVSFNECPSLDTLLLGQVRIISLLWFCGENTTKDIYFKGTYTNTDIFSMATWQWEERMQRGLFRYDVTTCDTKVGLMLQPFFQLSVV